MFLRQYPHGEIGAHLFGTVGEMTAEQQKDPRYHDVALGDRVGQAGVELQYDRFLRGRNGASRVQVDALGNLNADARRRAAAARASQLRLSVDLDVQEAGQQALAGGTGRGAFAVMDVHNGEVLGLGSQPSFDPNIFSKGDQADGARRAQDPDNGAPLSNRAIQGGYPTGLHLQADHGHGRARERADHARHGAQRPGLVHGRRRHASRTPAAWRTARSALRQALTVSSDVFFYQLGPRPERATACRSSTGPTGSASAADTGIDLPGELPGLLPTPKWRDAPLQRTSRPTDRPWGPGDNVNLSVGQGDLQADPMQMAVAYAAIANGGRVLRPRLGQRIEDSSGRALQQLDAPTARRARRSSPSTARRSSTASAAPRAHPGGTSTAVFDGFPIQVAGKTGTAEHVGQARPVLVRGARALPEPEVRGGRDRRGGRLRRRHGGADGAPHPRRALRRQGGPARPGRRARPTDAPRLATAVKDFRDAPARASCRSTRCCCSPRSA